MLYRGMFTLLAFGLFCTGAQTSLVYAASLNDVIGACGMTSGQHGGSVNLDCVAIRRKLFEDFIHSDKYSSEQKVSVAFALADLANKDIRTADEVSMLERAAAYDQAAKLWYALDGGRTDAVGGGYSFPNALNAFSATADLFHQLDSQKYSADIKYLANTMRLMTQSGGFIAPSPSASQMISSAVNQVIATRGRVGLVTPTTQIPSSLSAYSPSTTEAIKGTASLEGTWVRTAFGCEGSPVSSSNAASRMTLEGIPDGLSTMLLGPTQSGFDGGVIAFQSPYSIKTQGTSTILEEPSTTATYGQGVANETSRGKVEQLPKGSTYQVTLAGGQLTLYSLAGNCKTRSFFSFRKASFEEIAAINQQIVLHNSNLAPLLASSDGSQNLQKSLARTGRAAELSPGKCNWSNDFSLIRDPGMLESLRNQNFAANLQQGGLPIDQQITSGEGTLAQISGSLPSIEETIRGISQPTITHYNFRFDYASVCQHNSNKDALLAAECQHVNVENTRYAMNGTLQIMDCMAGRPIRADIGPNRDTIMPQDEVLGAVNAALVIPAPPNCFANTSGDTAPSPRDPRCPPLPASTNPTPGAKITK